MIAINKMFYRGILQSFIIFTDRGLAYCEVGNSACRYLLYGAIYTTSERQLGRVAVVVCGVVGIGD